MRTASPHADAAITQFVRDGRSVASVLAAARLGTRTRCIQLVRA